jgi:FkbM family methyltransferase
MEVKIKGKTFQVSSQPEDYWRWVGQGNYDREWTVYDEHLKPEHTFVDLGAWVGAHSLYAKDVAKQVISVEPDPEAVKILRKNLIMSFPGKWHSIYACAVTGEHGAVVMGSGLLGASTTRTNPNAGAGIGPWEEGQTFKVGCMPLAELVEDTEGPLFIKMDIEGSEEAVLKDLSLFANRKPIVLIELHPWWWADEQQTWKDVNKLGQMYRVVKSVFHNTLLLHD